jgi:hypothetical protein
MGYNKTTLNNGQKTLIVMKLQLSKILVTLQFQQKDQLRFAVRRRLRFDAGRGLRFTVGRGLQFDAGCGLRFDVGGNDCQRLIISLNHEWDFRLITIMQMHIT